MRCHVFKKMHFSTNLMDKFSLVTFLCCVCNFSDNVLNSTKKNFQLFQQYFVKWCNTVYDQSNTDFIQSFASIHIKSRYMKYLISLAWVWVDCYGLGLGWVLFKLSVIGKGSISPMFYEQLLRAQIPKVQ